MATQAERYAFSSTGASGTTDDLQRAKTWLSHSLPPAALYIRLDIYQQVFGLLRQLRDTLNEFETLSAVDGEVWDAIDRVIEQGMADYYLRPSVKTS